MEEVDDADERGPHVRRRSRRRCAGVVLAVAMLPALPALGQLPTGTLLVEPGPAFALSGELRVDGRPASGDLHGDYLYTTIAVTDARLGDLLPWGNSSREIVPRSRILPDGVDEDVFLAEQHARFAEAVADAEAAVRAELGRAPETEIEVRNAVVGGPSAGLLIAVAAIDARSPADLAAGRRVSGTGAVERDGSVRDVGSVAMKVRGAAAAGADVFLVPSALAEEALDVVDEDGLPLRILPVDTVGEAVAALTTG